MSISIPSSEASVRAVQATAGAANGADDGAHATAGARVKSDLNVSIVQASLSVSIGAGDESLALVYKAALTAINEELRADFGEDAIAHAASQDNSPQATADRIVSLSTAFYETFRKQHDGRDPSEVLKTFLDTLRGGVDRGFREARSILEGLKVLGGDIAANIDQTYALVMKGFDAFAAANAPQDASAQAA